jgi:hypothetical protein
VPDALDGARDDRAIEPFAGLSMPDTLGLGCRIPGWED